MLFLRRMFCNQDFKFESTVNVWEAGASKPYKVRKVYICNKCLKKVTIEL